MSDAYPMDTTLFDQKYSHTLQATFKLPFKNTVPVFASPLED